MNQNTILASALAAIVIIGGVYLFSRDVSPNPVDAIETNQSPITSGEDSEPGTPDSSLPVEPAAAAARKDLAARLSVDEKSIVILQITDTTWNDGCLGLGQANESCMQALVPGFKVEMNSKGKTYVYRTDKTGTSLRSETN